MLNLQHIDKMVLMICNMIEFQLQFVTNQVKFYLFWIFFFFFLGSQIEACLKLSYFYLGIYSVEYLA